MEERIMGSAPCMYHAAPEKGGQAVLRRENAGESDILYIDVPYAGAYGMGEKYNGLNQKGKTAVNQVVEKFCRQGENTYLAAPFFVTDTGLGIYVETAEKTEFRFRETIECEIPAEAAVHVFTGTIEEIIYEDFRTGAASPKIQLWNLDFREPLEQPEGGGGAAEGA